MTKNFIALGSNLIIRAVQAEEAKTSSGFIMEDAEKSPVFTAIVINIGPEFSGAVSVGDEVVVAFKDTVPTGVDRVLVASKEAIRAVVVTAE